MEVTDQVHHQEDEQSLAHVDRDTHQGFGAAGGVGGIG